MVPMIQSKTWKDLHVTMVSVEPIKKVRKQNDWRAVSLWSLLVATKYVCSNILVIRYYHEQKIIRVSKQQQQHRQWTALGLEKTLQDYLLIIT